MRRSILGLVLTASLMAGGPAALAGEAQGPPSAGCPPSGGWTLRDAAEHPPQDLNGDGWICGRDMEVPPFPGADNYRDNTVKPTA